MKNPCYVFEIYIISLTSKKFRKDSVSNLVLTCIKKETFGFTIFYFNLRSIIGF